MAEAALLKALQAGTEAELEYMAAVAPEAMLLPVGGAGSALHWALLNGSTQVVHHLLCLVPAEGLAVLDRHGMRPAHCAAARGNLEALMALFGASPLACAQPSTDGRTLAHYGAPHSHILEYLVAVLLPADLSARDRKGRTPLHFAARGEFPGPVQAILLGVKPEDVLCGEAVCGATPLHWAAEHGCLESLRMLLEAVSGEDLGCIDNTGSTVLHYAARSVSQRREKLALLLGKLNSESVCKQDCKGYTALHSFAQRACGAQTCTVEAELLLFSSPTLLEYRDHDGRTALHCATAAAHTDLMQLLAKRSPPHIRATVDNYGRTFLHYAIETVKDASVLADFVASMPAVGLVVQDSSGRTCLHLACLNGSFDLVRLLCNATPERAVTAVDLHGQTALHVAALHCPSASFQVILNQLASVGWDSLDQLGRSARDLAIGRGRDQIATMMMMPPKSAIE